MLREILKDRNMSIYRLAKLSGIPYATCNDIVSGKARLEKCSAETVYRISNVLGVSMEEMLSPYLVRRGSFENFKSSVCHRVKDMGDLNFIVDVLESDEIRTLFKRRWYPEALYLLGMVDYLSGLNGIPLCTNYNDIRAQKLAKPVFPTGVLLTSMVLKSEEPLRQAEKNAIPEFLRFNIVESEVRNVV